MLSTVRTYASFVKFSHTVFALPFAIAGMVAAYAVPILLSPMMPNFAFPLPFSWKTFALILLCMVGARCFAMAMNRILDRKIDALNPRTAQREIPTGAVSLPAAWAFAAVSAAMYFAGCFLLGQNVLLLSPVPIALMTLYPQTKRFTPLCHVVLGASLGLAPVGAWVAVRAIDPALMASDDQVLSDFFPGYHSRHAWYGAGWSALTVLAPWTLGAAVMFWVAGFDIIYALQDDDFDRANKLHSIPASLGRDGALRVARIMHCASAALFFGFVYVLKHLTELRAGIDVAKYAKLAPWVWAAPVVMLVGMIYQHMLVKPNDLSRVNVAFFTVNGVISVVFGAIFVAAWLLA